MNLYPFNYYILYIAIALVIVMLILTLLKVFPLLNALEKMSHGIEEITKKSEILAKEAEVLASKPQVKSPIDAKTALSALLLLKAILKNYKNSPENGVKQFTRSTSQEFTKRSVQQALGQSIKQFVEFIQSLF